MAVGPKVMITEGHQEESESISSDARDQLSEKDINVDCLDSSSSCSDSENSEDDQVE